MIEAFEGEKPHEGVFWCNAARVGTSLSSGPCAIRSCHFPACWRLGWRFQGSGHCRPSGASYEHNTRRKDDGTPGLYRPEDFWRSCNRWFVRRQSSDPSILYWKPNSNRDLEYRVASYEATVNESNCEMTGVSTQEGSWPLNFKRMTWQAKIPKGPGHGFRRRLGGRGRRGTRPQNPL